MQTEFKNETWSWEITLKTFVEEGSIDPAWKDFFQRADVKSDLEKISTFLEEERKKNVIIYPEIYNVFRAFSLPLKDIKLVILGQDCYHDGNAVGLCFSVPRNGKINPSLRNIYQELQNEGYNPNQDGDLSHWQKQGCMMLNTALTVEKGSPESHLAIWYDFSEKVLKEIANHNDSIAWLLMGAKALKFRHLIKNEKSIFATSHPSPFSAYKGFGQIPAFIGSNIFKKINTFLKENGKEEINW